MVYITGGKAKTPPDNAERGPLSGEERISLVSSIALRS